MGFRLQLRKYVENKLKWLKIAVLAYFCSKLKQVKLVKISCDYSLTCNKMQ